MQGTVVILDSCALSDDGKYIMKVKSEITIKCTNYNGMVERLICQYYPIMRSVSSGGIEAWIEIMNHPQELENFLSELDEIGITYKFRQETTYRREEIKKFEYGFLILPNAQAVVCGPYATLDDLNPEIYGTVYSPPQCPFCNAGRKQTNKLHIPLRAASKFEISKLLSNIIIKSDLIEAFQEKGFTGISIGECIDSKTENEVPFKQLIINNTLPSMSEKTEIEWVECSRCGKKYWKTVPDKLFFSIKDKKKFKDFNISQEQYSYLGVNMLPAGIPIVSNRVISYILENKCKQVTFKPILFVE